MIGQVKLPSGVVMTLEDDGRWTGGSEKDRATFAKFDMQEEGRYGLRRGNWTLGEAAQQMGGTATFEPGHDLPADTIT